MNSKNKKTNMWTIVQFILCVISIIFYGLDRNWAAVSGWLCAAMATINVWYSDKYIEILQDYIKREK
jgi:TM2 domain-containing membrane protein YozV